MKIVFTSCARYNKNHQQTEWKKIQGENPDHLFLLGDNIYMDWGVLIGKPYLRGLAYFKSRMNKMYSIQWGNLNFKNLIDIMIHKNGLHGIWDDHDCGWNNIKGGSLKPKGRKKLEYSREKFLSKFPFSNANNNIYYSHDVENIRFIFLDNRSYATNRRVKKKKYLGDEQFEFLEDRLNNDKPLTIICGGLTLSSGHEKFESYESAYSKFCELVSNSPSKVIYLSGDIHKNKFVTPDNGATSSEGIKPPFEIISSGVSKEVQRKHRWCMAEINNANQATISFYSKGKKEIARSTECTNELNNYLG